MTNRFEEFFYQHDHLPIHKWTNYFTAYDNHLSKYIRDGIAPTILHIGGDAGAIQMLRYAFDDKVKIFVLSSKPTNIKQSPNVTVIVGQEANQIFLNSIKNKVAGKGLDIIIDAGDHNVNHQIANFNILFNWLSESGVYIVEATHTSYWSAYGGGVNKKGTFLEFAKALIDNIHVNHSYSVHCLDQTKIQHNPVALNVESLTFYDSIFVAEKKDNQDTNSAILRGHSKHLDIKFKSDETNINVNVVTVDDQPSTDKVTVGQAVVGQAIEIPNTQTEIVDLVGIEDQPSEPLVEVPLVETKIKRKKKGLGGLLGKLKKKTQ